MTLSNNPFYRTDEEWAATPREEQRELLDRWIDYQDRNRRASSGQQAHDYCWGTNCISCGCSANGPCISHRPLRAPVVPTMPSPQLDRIEALLTRLVTALETK